ncbi:MAG: EAL domain-containing protein [Lachnospiraceae bacterium]|nr:EAL domain-containing protein [Lachnospiraceae bacterium]
MPYTDVAIHYSPTGDIITMLVLLVFAVMIYESLFVSMDENFKLFKQAMVSIFMACIFNIAFFYLTKLDREHIFALYATRACYNLALVTTMYIFIMYLLNLVGIDDKSTRNFKLIVRVAAVLLSILLVATHFTHFGFYRDMSTGLWSRSGYLNAFVIAYALSVFGMGYILIRYSERMILQVSIMMLTCVGLSLITVIIDNIDVANEYLAFSYLLPMIGVIVMIHSRPYNLTTGAMSEEAFGDFSAQAYKNGTVIDYYSIEFMISTGNHDIPMEVGRALYKFERACLKHGVLFNLRPRLYVAAVYHDKMTEADTQKIDHWIKVILKEYYNKFKIDYKIQIYRGVDYIYELRQIINYLDLRAARMKCNEIFLATPEDVKELARTKYIAGELKKLAAEENLDNEHVLVYCQPVKNVKSGRFDSAEALARMTLPETALISPDKFIPVAERINVIHSLTKIILNKTCKEIRKLMDEGYEFDRVSVNVSVSEFKIDTFLSDITGIIEKNNVPYDKIALEITESTNDADYDFILEVVGKLRKLGVRIYLDDFGTGYSNFDRILSLGIDVVKFDRSLLLAWDKDRAVKVTLRHFSAAFRDLNYKLLFEGIETDEHEGLCFSCGADYLQGYRFSKPVPIEEYRNYLTKR